jgi:hypothetical protein
VKTATKLKGALGYPTKDVASILKMSQGQVRAFVRDGFVEPVRGNRREFYFSFQDIVVLRAARDLWRKLPAKRVHRALRTLKQSLPSGRDLAGVQIVTEGNEICIREGDRMWEAESGQALLDFEVSEVATLVAPLAQSTVRQVIEDEDESSAEDWFSLAVDLEAYAQDEAKEAYVRTLELEPEHVQACLNLGRLMHDLGDLPASVEYYRMGLQLRPDDGVAWFNLGVLFEELDLPAEAISAHKSALNASDPCHDSHYNIARLYELQGDTGKAIEHLDAYKEVLSARPSRLNS